MIVSMDENSGSVNDWYNKGESLYNLERYHEAIECFDKVLSIQSNDIKAINAKALSFAALGLYEVAIKYYDKSLEISPKHKDTWNNKARALIKLERYSEAVGCFDEVIEIDPSYADAWYDKGKLLYELGEDEEEAVKCFDKVIEIKPDYLEAGDHLLTGKQILEKLLLTRTKMDWPDSRNPDAWCNKGDAMIYYLGKFSDTYGKQSLRNNRVNHSSEFCFNCTNSFCDKRRFVSDWNPTSSYLTAMKRITHG
jgi:tetratricopeptide (TPR) repeat protein